MQQHESPGASGSQPHASATSTRAPTTRLRFIFLVLVALSVVSVLAVSSRMGVSLSPSARLKALQTSHQQLVETSRQGTGAEHYETHEDGSDRVGDKSTEALHVLEDPATDGIPRIIHQSWKSVYRIPTRFHPWMKSWRDFHPTWAYVFWTDEDNLRLFQQLYPQYLHVAKAVKKVSLADMARYALLHRVGGLYVDADFECLQPFDELRRGRNLFLSSEPLVHAVLLEKSRSAALCNALMASAPAHPFWLQVLDNIKEKFDRERLRSDAVELTGPRMVKQTYESFNSSFNSDIEVFPSEYFYPEVAYWNKEPMEQACRRRRHDDAAAREACDWLSKFPRGEFTNNTHATHHWQCTWCRDAQLDEFGPLRDVFESPSMRPNITSTGIEFVALK